MIILEGLDAVGKTTFANLLAERLGTSVIHSSKPKMNMGWVEYLDRGKKAGSVVFDRFHIGEAVWPIIFEDGRKPMLRWQQQMVERVLMQRNALLVYMTDSLEIINSRLKARGEKELSYETYIKTHYLFVDSCVHSLLDHGVILEPSTDEEGTINAILSHYAQAKADPLNLSRFRGCGSRQQGNIMIIGYKDPQNLNILDFEYAPLCRLTDRILHTALQLSGNTGFYLTYFRKTGNNKTDRQALVDEFLSLNPSKVIAIDRDAHDVCANLVSKDIILAEKKSNPHEYAEFFK